jgi:hypothetical protein
VTTTAPTPRPTSARAPSSTVAAAGEAEHLLVVGQQVADVRQRVRDPVEDAGLARRQQVGGGDDARRRARREDLGRVLAAHQLRAAEVQVGGPLDVRVGASSEV